MSAAPSTAYCVTRQLSLRSRVFLMPPVTASFMKRVCGFSAVKRPRVLLLQRPSSPGRVSKAKVIIAIERGRPRFKPPTGDIWFTPGPDPLALAKRLFPSIVSTCCMSSPARTPMVGLPPLIGSDSWAEEPSD